MRLQVRVFVVLMVILNKLVFHIKFQTRQFQFQADHKNGLGHVWVGGQWRIIFSPISVFP